VFIDHAKGHYLPDLRRILERGWLHPGSVVVADNIKVPGAPAYHAYLREREGRGWRTVEHDTHVEYQPKTPDLVLESTYLGGRETGWNPAAAGPETGSLPGLGATWWRIWKFIMKAPAW